MTKKSNTELLFDNFPIALAEKALNVKFKNPKLLANAFVHRSYLNEVSAPDTVFTHDNERLEFLGDSVLSLIVSEHLYLTYPDQKEGILTHYRSVLVRTESLADMTTQLDLAKFLFLSKGEHERGGVKTKSILANTYEAVLGAIFLDLGMLVAKKFVFRTLLKGPSSDLESSLLDPKSRLQEIVQKRFKSSPFYKTVSESGPDHAKTFTIEVMINRVVSGTGVGNSKQEAQQDAAKAALNKLTEK
ncbi:ribonuclease III [Candidatus Curtissbacteria bacterium]|nr:ribonuclease III [Candidatus Curtissbacteria bacterium]